MPIEHDCKVHVFVSLHQVAVFVSLHQVANLLSKGELKSVSPLLISIT